MRVLHKPIEGWDKLGVAPSGGGAAPLVGPAAGRLPLRKGHFLLQGSVNFRSPGPCYLAPDNGRPPTAGYSRWQ